MTSSTGRLAGKVALITGGAGNIGEVMTRSYLAEGATVVISGRNVEKLQTYRLRLVEETGVAPERVLAIRMDGSRMDEVRTGIADIIERVGRLDVLVNNAGSSGPRRRLADIPLTAEEVQAPDTETLTQAIGNLIGLTWNTIRAAAPFMQAGGSIINVSTIFSRADYYGRIAYVAPKAALNALSQVFAKELGARGIRVNTIYPGPIESERIHTVFKAMDGLKGLPDGSTAGGFFEIMRLATRRDGDEITKTFPTPLDVAATAVFLGSDESRAFAGHAFEVTHGMDLPTESRTTFVSRPGLRTIDASGKVVLICADTQVDDALAFADVLRAGRATVVVTFRNAEALATAEERLRELQSAPEDMYGRTVSADTLFLQQMDPLNPTDALQTLTSIHQALGSLDDAIILPFGMQAAGVELSAADDTVAEAFLHEAIGGAIATAVCLARFWREYPPVSDSRVLFVTDPDDEQGNRLADVLRAAVEELARVWRHESQLDSVRGSGWGVDEVGRAAPGVWVNQVVRYTNAEPASRDFAAAWMARLVGSSKRIEEINLYLPSRLAGSIGIHTRGFGWAESLFGLHMDKVALITGGSAGIGGQIGRLLAMSGAKVMLSARKADQLEEMRADIVRELREAGYPRPERRVQTLANCDVGNPEDLERLVEHTLAVFGRVDYLINNAGVAGAEEMVVDMPLDGWRQTLEANLISNYRLIRWLAPQMKKRGGHILNVSSYFGGEKYVAIPYPNRSDYAVSKAGQRAMVEALARFLGPEIQINAIAPGPVEGDRLRGTGERPGLFARRAKLILENKRLNDIMAALFEARRATNQPIADLISQLMRNEVQAMADGGKFPAPFRKLAQTILAKSDREATSRLFLMNEQIARRLIRRMVVSGSLSTDELLRSSGRLIGPAATPPEPFFTTAQIDQEAAKVRDGVMGMLELGRMPTEFDVALATVYYLADHNITGETFHPSGGLKLDRTVTEGELFGKANPQRLEKLRGSTFFLFGEHLVCHLTRLAANLFDEHEVGRVVILTETPEGARKLRTELAQYADTDRLIVEAVGNNIESALDRAINVYGNPACVVSTPFRPLPNRKLSADGAWDDVLTGDEFADLVEQNITHHLRIAQKASLIDGCNLVLITPETSSRSTSEEFAMANFIKTSLHALTATLGAESERVVPHVPVNQVDLTRRARSEEPRGDAEEEEELVRFVQAVLLVAAPLPAPQESRYRARIYRGNAITV